MFQIESKDMNQESSDDPPTEARLASAVPSSSQFAQACCESLINPGHDRRKHAIPAHGCFSSQIGQLVVQYKNNPSLYRGTASLLYNDKSRKTIITCAHNFTKLKLGTSDDLITYEKAWFYMGKMDLLNMIPSK